MKTDFSNKLRAREKSSGFSLIEVMIAIVVLVIGLTALMALFAKSLSAVQSSQDARLKPWLKYKKDSVELLEFMKKTFGLLPGLETVA